MKIHEKIIIDNLEEYWEHAKQLRDSININGNIFRVEFVNRIGNNPDVYGLTSNYDIFVLSTLDYKTKQEVLFHEFIHALAITIDPIYNNEKFVRRVQKEFYDKIKYGYNLQLDSWSKD